MQFDSYSDKLITQSHQREGQRTGSGKETETNGRAGLRAGSLRTGECKREKEREAHTENVFERKWAKQSERDRMGGRDGVSKTEGEKERKRQSGRVLQFGRDRQWKRQKEGQIEGMTKRQKGKRTERTHTHVRTHAQADR